MLCYALGQDFQVQMLTWVIVYDGESRDKCWPKKSFGLNADVTSPYLKIE